MMKTHLFFTIFLLLAFCSCNDGLWEGAASRNIGRFHETDSGDTGQNPDYEFPEDPDSPVFYLAGIEYPPGYDWRRDTGYGTVECRLFLMRNGRRIFETDVGFAHELSSDSDMSRCIGGHVYSDYSTAGETVIKKDGIEMFRYPGREMILGFLMPDGKAVHTIGAPREGEGWTYRINGVITASSETGFPVTELYIDAGMPTFGYRVHADDFYGLEDGCHIFQNGQKLKVPPPGPDSEIADFRLFRNTLYVLFTDDEGKPFISINGENEPIELPEGTECHSLKGFICDDNAIYATGMVEDASGNIITIVWSGTEIYRSFEPGFYATACYCEDANICAIGHLSDSTPVFCRDGEYTEFPEGYSFPSGSFACFSERHYCLSLFPNSASLPPVYVIDGEIFTADINGYIFSVCTEET